MAPKDGFWRHIVQRANLILPRNARCIALDGLRYAKVYELQLSLNHEEVGRFQIAVDNSGLMDRLDCLQTSSPQESDAIDKAFPGLHLIIVQPQ